MRSFILSAFFLLGCHAQYPHTPSNLTILKSPVDGNITISYKAPAPGTCTTVFPTQQQYTGWVNVPGDYPTNTFFWFIASREPTSQLTIWLNGGPGSSSMLGLFTENGPCEAYEVAQNQFATRARNWGWDRGSNMIYIDQPTQVGFSYDTPTNGSLDLMTSDIYTPPQILPNSQPADTFYNGTFSSLNTNHTANTTETAALAMWHMLQGFLGAFPQYNPNNTAPGAVGINLFVESYGGKYGPAFATVWEEQNQKLLINGTRSNNETLAIQLVSLGIINGCVDDLVQAPYYPIMANSNSYGLTAINPTRASLANASFYAATGCQVQIQQCREAVASQDPNDVGNVTTVNSICSNANTFCTTQVMEPYSDSGRSFYDIAHLLPDSFPPSTYLEYLNSPAVQLAIGTPVNFTGSSNEVISAFSSTGDYERDSYIPKIAKLVASGVRVGLIYGDRDYICNWYGGEAVSLDVAAGTSGAYLEAFTRAGYAPIIVNSSYIGGVVRQYGNLSFSRIYDAGHSVPAYQPETAFQVFARIISGNSVSTGEAINLASYNSSGPLQATETNSLPASPSSTCWLRNIPGSCSTDEKNMILGGEGVIINGILYSAASDWPLAGASSSSITAAQAPTSPPSPTTSEVMTGFYTATTTPSTKATASRISGHSTICMVALVAIVLLSY